VPDGETAVIEVSELTVKLAGLAVPNLTAVAPLRFVPVIVTEVPPAAGPAPGFTLAIVGTGGGGGSPSAGASATRTPTLPSAFPVFASLLPVALTSGCRTWAMMPSGPATSSIPGGAVRVSVAL